MVGRRGYKELVFQQEVDIGPSSSRSKCYWSPSSSQVPKKSRVLSTLNPTPLVITSPKQREKMPLYAGGYSCRLAHNANTATSVPERDVTTSADGKWAACKVPPEAIFGGMCMLKLDSSLTTRDIVLPHKYDRVFIFEDGKLTGQNDFHMCGHSDLHASTRVAVDYAGVEVPRDYQRMIEIVIVSFGTKIPELALGSPNTLTKFAAQFSFRTDRRTSISISASSPQANESLHSPF